MHRIFTRNFILLVLGFVSINLIGQNINTLTINSPAGIAGDYTAVRASFGSQSNTPITANGVFVDDGSTNGTFGCSGAVNNISGLIAFIDRGTCQFGTKALNAENKGALVAIICNNLPNEAQGAFPMVPGDDGGSVNIPVFSVSYGDCLQIRADILAGGVNATLRNTCENTTTFGPNVVWGNVKGQGDFSGGLGDWSVDKENTWEFNEDGNISKGAYGGTQMTSGSACDGVMEFNSDWLDNEGIQGNFGAGLCPAVCTGELISPTIDLSATTVTGITIEFTQALRQFQSQFYLIVSKNGGVSWPDTVQFNTSYPVNSAAISGERLKLALVGYQGVSSLRFKFRYVGNYYYWGIDDVVVNNESFTDVQVNENFYAAAPSLKVPATQVSEMPFLADVSNLGNGSATSVNLDIVITDATSGDEVYRGSNEYGTLTPGAVQENKPFAETFTPPATVGSYNGAYIITSTEDGEGDNNEVGFYFDVTENTFGNLLSETEVNSAYMEYVLTPWIVGGEVTYYSAGNIFYVTNGANMTVDKVRFGLANDLANINETGFINVDVYEWADLDDNNECAPLEREKVGTNAFFIDGNSIEDARNIELPIWALDADGAADEGVEVTLKDNTTYVVIAHTSPLDPSIDRYQLLGYTARTFTVDDRSVNYAAVTYAFDTLKIERNAGSLFGLTGASAEDVEERNFEIVQNGATQSAVYLEMDIKEKSSSTYDVVDNAVVSTFPNPAARELYIDLALENVSPSVKVDLVALDGKIATTKSFDNVQDARLKLELDAVVSGAYTLMINTNAGVITKKVVVQK